ncbi:MAG TPA: DUF5957 family protein [Thermomicrobiales bacterium]|nr:DUF5957 family protein [Thermomicrobiales bacterium]
MNIAVKILIGLVAGYIIGIILAAITAFVFDFEGAARFVAIGCGILGAILGPMILDRLGVTAR